MSLRSGVRWEQEALHRLQRLFGSAAVFVRTGGSFDGGVDVLGALGPSSGDASPVAPGARSVSVAVQCKRSRRPLGPSLVRELVGAVQALASWRTETAAAPASAPVQPALGLLLLAGEGGFTRAAATAVHASAHPMALLHIVEETDRQALRDMQAVAPNGIQVHGFAMNAAARALCPGLNVMQRRACAHGHRDAHGRRAEPLWLTLDQQML